MIFLVVLAIVAVAVVAYTVASSPLSPTPPASTPTAPTSAPSTPTQAPSTQPVETTPIPQDDVMEGATGEGTAEPTTPETPTPENYSSPANNAIEDGIHDAYFAKEEYVKSNDSAGNGEYTFKNDNAITDQNRANIASIIVTNINPTLENDKKYAKEESIISILTNDSYSKDEVITFELHKLKKDYVKIEFSGLSSEVFVIAKSFNLLGKEATITIHEKEELLVEKDAPLNVIEAKENNDDAQEFTELKTTFNDDGFAAIKIKLRPKQNEDLETWEEKLKGGVQDGTHSYTATNEFTVESEAEKTTIASTIETRSNTALAPNHIVKKDDIIALLTVGSSYAVLENIPKYKKGAQTEYLYLKVSCDGDEECHQEEFLNEDDNSYFEIENCAILVWGNKFSCEERKKVVSMAENLELGDDSAMGANWLMAVMALETGGTFDPSITNSLGYTGLIQFGDAAASDLGTTTTSLREMTVLQQLEYVESYFLRYKSRLTTLTDVYLSVLYPAASGNGTNPNYIVFDAASTSNYNRSAYRQNPAFFHEDTDSATNTTGKTYIWEIEREINEWYEDGKTHKNDCDCDKSWVDPLSTMDLRGWYSATRWAPTSSDYGYVRNNNTKLHDGLDLYAPVGTDTFACLDGEVSLKYTSSSYGNCLNIKADYNGTTYYFFYAHLSSVSVNEGDLVKAGDVIGQTGQTGNASNQIAKMAHLHFELRTSNSKTGGRIDPYTITELSSSINKTPSQTSQTG
ncbi:M23 family metallopeptidase [Lacinutrix sp. 5H-3-7-4]|uniref:M23 family metallopeptidase n=1 Tax=Lacinutrix sp. (strain 5H-3-7-4) TaxID=983544 RepID=UPI00020A38FC|nr:M23 family metallopeptidase [Lacinutrix sp. 5H-3-7-4]AEH02108.1 Peptidase M23 [Lacinutrix sp. 5H-3-7-4]